MKFTGGDRSTQVHWRDPRHTPSSTTPSPHIDLSGGPADPLPWSGPKATRLKFAADGSPPPSISSTCVKRTPLTRRICTYIHTQSYTACGLYYAAELAEEYASATKRIIAYSLVAVVALHALLIVESFPLLVLAGGVACHVVYGWLLMDFPSVEVFSLKFLFSLGALCADHYIWFQYLQSRPPTIKSAFQTMVRSLKKRMRRTIEMGRKGLGRSCVVFLVLKVVCRGWVGQV